MIGQHEETIVCQCERWNMFKASVEARNDETVAAFIKHIEEDKHYLDMITQKG